MHKNLDTYMNILYLTNMTLPGEKSEINKRLNIYPVIRHRNFKDILL